MKKTMLLMALVAVIVTSPAACSVPVLQYSMKSMIFLVLPAHAIPLNEISDENSVKNANSEKLPGEPETLWNFAMCRTAPGQAVQQAKPLMIEEFSAVSWIPGIIQR
jgi:hypothetical protein